MSLDGVLLVIAAWRLSRMLVAEDGPWDVLIAFRGLLRRVRLGQLAACIYCMSVWVALGLLILLNTAPAVAWPVIHVLALSAAVIGINRAGQVWDDVSTYLWRNTP